MRKRRCLKLCSLVISGLVVTVLLSSVIQDTEDQIVELCNKDREETNYKLQCNCDGFRFEPSSRLDNFINAFRSGGRHKTVLYLIRQVQKDRVVLKYRKQTSVTNRFNGQPYFCSYSNAKSRDLFTIATSYGNSDHQLLMDMNFEIVLLRVRSLYSHNYGPSNHLYLF